MKSPVGGRFGRKLRGLLGGLGGLSGLVRSLSGLGLGSLLRRRLLGNGLVAHEDDDLRIDVAVEVDLDGVATGGLDGGATNDALAVDVDAELGLDGLDDLLRGDGAKELAASSSTVETFSSRAAT